jgi:uncharacterized protein (TIGR03435 family)
VVVHFYRRTSAFLAAAGVLAFAAPLIIGQSNATPTAARALTFEVASIRLDKSDSGEVGFGFGTKGNRFTASNVPLKSLIQYAYGVNGDQILGAPAWVGSEHYDIEAEVDEAEADWLHALRPEQQMLLLKPLLEDRFKLQVHRETRLLPAYELVVARNGPKVKQATPDETYPNGFKSPDGAARPGTFFLKQGQQDQLTFQGLTMARLAQLLSKQVGGHVVDKTGLAGDYDFTLQWAPEDNPGAGPSIFTAVQEQLGLRLKSGKLPVECLVIDHVEHPSPN